VAKRVTVTGGQGFLGAALCARLVADGHTVRSLDNHSRGSRQVPGVNYITADVRSPIGCDFDETDTVFHLAAINGTRHFYERPEEVLDVQIRGTLNVLDACKANNVKELVLFSSSEVYGQADQIPTPETVPLKIADPFNPRFSYAAGKIAAEMMCLHAKHLDRVLVIRPHNVYGPDMGYEHVIPELIMRLARDPEPRELQSPSATRAFCHVTEFIGATLLAWEKAEARSVYHIGTLDEVRIREVATTIARHLHPGKRQEWTEVDAPDGSPKHRRPDISKLQALGWKPWRDGVPLAAGLKETIDWYLDHKAEWPTADHST
jgi:UDP-glucose 4-epimerase